MTSEQETAADLLEILWRGVPADYKGRYRMSIWQQFEDHIRSAAYTSNLSDFLDRLCARLQATVGRNSEDRQRALHIVEATDSRKMLKLLREQTTLLVLMVRVRNQERREAWEAEHQMEGD